MLKRHGLGVSEAIGAVIALGVTGVVGYSMVSGQCLLGSCDAGSANSAAAVPTATVVSADTGYSCSAGGGELADSGLILASDASTDEGFVACESGPGNGIACESSCQSDVLATIDGGESNLTVVNAETERECSAAGACSEASKSACQSEKPLD